MLDRVYSSPLENTCACVHARLRVIIVAWHDVWNFSANVCALHSFVCFAAGKTVRANHRSTPCVGFSNHISAAMPFQIPTPLSQASVEKRSSDGASPQQAKKAKLPPLSDLVAMEAAPKRQNAQRLPAVGPLNIVVYKARPLSFSRCHCVLASCPL